MNQGPSCFFIDGEETIKSNGLLSVLSQDLKTQTYKEKVPILLDRIKQLKETYTTKNSSSIGQVFNIQPKIQMSLLLTFESYDPKTLKGDFYIQEEKIVKFNIGYLKLNFGGKLKISYAKDENGKKLHTVSGGTPSNGSFGIVESEGKFKSNN